MDTITVGQQVVLKRDVTRTPLTVARIEQCEWPGHPEWGCLALLTRGPGDLGGLFWQNEFEAYTP